MKRLTLFCILGLVFTVQAQEKIIYKTLDSLQKTLGFPGVNFCVVLPSGKVIQAAVGFSDSLKKEVMSTNHRMLSGSNGKTLFMATTLHLASKKHFNLDDKIEKYLKDESWFEQLPNANTITLRMLLNHTSGLEEYYNLEDFMDLVKENPNRSFTPFETFKYILNRKPLFEAGSQWGYSDTNFILLGYILEKITHKSMYQWVDEMLLQPYQLTRTEPSTQRTFDSLATGYSHSQSPFPFKGAMVKNDSLVFNPQFEWMGGGFVSHVKDLANWVKKLYDLKEISKELKTEMKVKTPAKTGSNHAYGLGIQIRPSEKWGDSYGHSGWFPGYLTDAVYFPKKNLSLAIQFNTDQLNLLKKSPYDFLLQLAELILD